MFFMIIKYKIDIYKKCLVHLFLVNPFLYKKGGNLEQNGGKY